MTKDEAIDLVVARLGKRAYLKTDGIAEAEMALQQEAAESEAFLPWFLEYLDTYLPVDAASISVPKGFIRECEEGRLTLEDEGPQVCVREDYDVLKNHYSGATAARPEGYSLVGLQMFFFPTPDVPYVGTLRYYKQAEAIGEVADDETNAWLTYAANYLVNRTARVLATNLQNPGLLASLVAQEKLALDGLIASTIARETAARNLVKRD